jgi:ABC-2 type transport system permease protein
MNRFAWIPALALANLRSEAARPWNAAMLALFMAVNNLVWFAIWWLFFGLAGDIRGWTLGDVMQLFGIVATAYGIYATFFGGARHLAKFALDGSLDIYLGRPRAPLVGILFSRSDPTGIGDIVSGLGLVAWAADSPAEIALALVFAALGASVLVSAYVAINCLVFWTSGTVRAMDQIFDGFLTLSTFPQIGMPGIVQVLLYTVLPAAFVGNAPVEILREFSIGRLAGVVVAALACPVFAAWLFGRGLRRYASGNRMIDAR